MPPRADVTKSVCNEKCLTLFDARICGLPAERGSVFPGLFPELHPELVGDAPTRAWNRERGGYISATSPNMGTLLIPAEILLFFCGRNFMITDANL